jgi:opacity protein-like surface antigen
MKRAAMLLGVLAVVSITAVAQENRSEISIQGTGFFTKDTDGNGIRQHATDTGGFLLGYRYNLNRWLAAEANYGYDRNTQIYFGGTGTRVESNIHQITGSAVVKLPSFARLQPYALAGGGALVFDPTGNGGGFAGATTETRGAFVYGAGADYAFTRHISLRAEYRGYESARFQSRRLEYRQLDAYCATVSRHRVPLLINRGRRRGTGVQPNTRATCSKEEDQAPPRFLQRSRLPFVT